MISTRRPTAVGPDLHERDFLRIRCHEVVPQRRRESFPTAAVSGDALDEAPRAVVPARVFKPIARDGSPLARIVARRDVHASQARAVHHDVYRERSVPFDAIDHQIDALLNCASRVDLFARSRHRGPDVVRPTDCELHSVGALPYIILARRPDLRCREATKDEGTASHGLLPLARTLLSRSMGCPQ